LVSRPVSGCPRDPGEEGGVIQMTIRELWDRLDAGTQKWLMDNPGCQILPRTTSATIMAAGGDAEADRHGQLMVSEEDRDFIRGKAAGAPAASAEYRFFDAEQPGE
jgi:hypothetical protein